MEDVFACMRNAIWVVETDAMRIIKSSVGTLSLALFSKSL